MELNTGEATGKPQMMHKNRLQEFAQRAGLHLPIYQTINEGAPHAPKFRSSVLVDDVTYTSRHTFTQRKEAEKDVAKLAFESIFLNLKGKKCPFFDEEMKFCKSILNEFAIKMNLPLPTYITKNIQGLLPAFTSSLEFDGKTYTTPVAPACRSKKEAEQLLARTVLQSILDSNSGIYLFEIIKSKTKLCEASTKTKESDNAQDTRMQPLLNATDDYESFTGKRKEFMNGSTSEFVENAPVVPPPTYELKRPKTEMLCETNTDLTGNVAPTLNQPMNGCLTILPSIKTTDFYVGRIYPRMKNRKKKQKKPQADDGHGQMIPLAPAQVPLVP